MNIRKIIREEIQSLSSNKIEESNKYLDKFLHKLSLLNEVKDVLSPEFEWDVISNDKTSPEYVWDFPQETKKELDLSKKWVKTKEDVIGYLNLLLKKIKSLPNQLRKKIIKYVLASFLGILTVNQITSITNTIEGNDYQSGIRFEMPSFKKETPVVKTQKIRKPSQRLFKHLKKEEGIGGKPVLYFYNLGDGAYTTGYGHAVFSNPERGSTGGDYSFVPNHEDIIPYNRKNPGKKITRITIEQAEQLLQDDMLKASKGVNTILDEWETDGIKPKITQGMYDAMVSIAYNHGVGNLRMSNFIQYVKRSEFQEAKEEIKNISSNMFDEYPGLKTRREKESRLFMS
jgi:GH24 family phage-related lysozyme (muramidase)